MVWLWLGIAFAVAFLLGSIPSGIIIGKLVYHTDIRKVGSGNIGTTNAIRALGKKGGYIVFLLDFGKGVLAALLTWLIAVYIVDAGGLDPQYTVTHAQFVSAGFCGATLGHIYSPWLGWHGGKGIAVAVGCLFVTFGPLGALLELTSFIVVVLVTRHVSAGSVTAAALCPFFAAYYYLLGLPSLTMWAAECETGDWLAWGLCTIAALAVLWAHRENIARLRAGTERSVGKSKE